MRDSGTEVKPQGLVKYFCGLFATDNKVGLINDIQIQGPQYTEELDRNFTVEEVTMMIK
jgi:hypothetical protein